MPYYKRKPKHAKKVGKVTKKDAHHIARKEIQSVAEKKYLEDNDTGEFNNVTAQLSRISGMAQNTTAIGRVGNKITPTSLRVNCTCNFKSDSTQQYDWIRCMVVQWFENENDHNFAASDCIQGNAVSNPYNVLAAYSQTNKKTFRVLYDQCKLMDYSKGRSIKFSTLIPGSKIKPVKFAGANAGYGQIFLILMSQKSTGTNQVQFDYQCMLRYIDC